ncbi:hypothetical protein FISHEDRAFT_62906 [Fistulina hepatica ATCC 64428]|uniref:Uncharacterized protein n=1 Tax=Fistulina hepatica ATCC 64428 TaxID=1128425 RepID=A0A0D7A036_9AGAR|nr:hypothetical protein FISHEDRAFT_62906 [Fistulina hepatica ATCC 64428]
MAGCNSEGTLRGFVGRNVRICQSGRFIVATPAGLPAGFPSQMVRVQFFPNDQRLPDKLKKRILGWYPADYLVKPQALIRDPKRDEEDDDDIDFDVGNTTVDSMGVRVGISQEDVKRYPDLRRLLIVEVASVGHNCKEHTKGFPYGHKVIGQAEEYLDKLGEHGSRWHTLVVGIGIVGYHCVCIKQSYDAVNKEPVRSSAEWMTIYSARFRQVLQSVIGLPYPIN